jgi:hypothetical protein
MSGCGWRQHAGEYTQTSRGTLLAQPATRVTDMVSHHPRKTVHLPIAVENIISTC